MKKMCVVIVVFLILLSCAETNESFTLLNYFSGEYTVYTSTNSNNGKYLGFCYMSETQTSKDVIGESLVIYNLELDSALKNLNANVVKTEYLDDGTVVIYAHTNLINKTEKVGGKRINLQIAHKNDRFVIGWPLILGSF